MLNIREGQPSDLAEITRFDQQLMVFDQTFDPTLNLSWPLSQGGQEFYKARLSRAEGIAWIAEDEGRMVGYLLGCLNQSAEYSRPEVTAEIECLYVDPSRRGEGIGGRLIERFEAWAQAAGARRLRVTVSAANRSALRFYRRRGFRCFDVVLDKPISGEGSRADGG